MRQNGIVSVVAESSRPCEKKRAPMWRPFEFKRLVRALFCGCLLCHAALVAGSGVLVNEAFASGPIEERNCGAVVIARRRASMSFLERGAEGGALGAVARHGGSGLTHVLLGGRNIRHWQISIGFGPSRLVRQPLMISGTRA